MPGGPVIIIIDPDGEEQESVVSVMSADPLSDADRIRALADRVEAGEVQVRFAR